MRATVPLDVDLEDRIVYGLTPVRLAYMVIAVLSGLAIWSTHGAPVPLRGFAAVFVITAGALLAWGRWRGRAVDAWALDLARFVTSNYRVTWDTGWIMRIIHRPHPADPDEPDAAAP